MVVKNKKSGYLVEYSTSKNDGKINQVFQEPNRGLFESKKQANEVFKKYDKKGNTTWLWGNDGELIKYSDKGE